MHIPKIQILGSAGPSESRQKPKNPLGPIKNFNTPTDKSIDFKAINDFSTQPST
jgi:hypothetical protein